MTTELPSACATVRSIAAGEISAEAVVEAALARIDACEPTIRAWETLDADGARRRARALDRAWAAGAPRSVLGGVPIAVKDIIDTADLPTGHGTPIYRGARPAADAWCVARLRDADGIVIGKSVTTEFAYFDPGPTANPCNPAHTPGGSSSGSAAAVASGMVPLAFGTQTAASLIRPASYCGVFALKPTHGSVSLAGVRPFAPSLDTLGWLARSADDLELMRAAMAGERFVPLDAIDPSELRLRGARTHEWPQIDEGGAAAWDDALARIARRGRAAEIVDLPAALAGLADAQRTVMAHEAAHHLAGELRDHRERLSAPLTALLDAGRAIDAERYEAARAFAVRGRAIVADLMRDVDALLVPAAPGEAPRGLHATGDPVFSRVWTLLGLPCVTVPGLTGPNGLPIGIQLIGHPGQERRLLRAAATLHRLLAEHADA